LKNPESIQMAACYDALSAKLVESAGFPATFMSGFGVAATRLGLPDTGLISYGELLDQGRNICSAVSIPVLGDGDTGFGNAMNVKRTVQGYYQAGFACIMIENGKTPLLPITDLQEMGYKIIVYALTLLNASINSMRCALACLKRGAPVTDLVDFQILKQIVGFDTYDVELAKYHGQE
jgi:2-methylisocitrate lyase-like PEP mutase family enzyme